MFLIIKNMCLDISYNRTHIKFYHEPTHFKLSICFSPFFARIGNPVFYISIRLSLWVFKIKLKKKVLRIIAI
jgi:hypothetical protein